MRRMQQLAGEGAGSIFELADGEHVAGRSHSVDLRLLAADISGKHLRLSVDGDRVTVENLGRSGTFVDGQPVTAPTAWTAGQELRLGATTVFSLEAAAALAAGDRPTGVGGSPDPAPAPPAPAAPTAPGEAPTGFAAPPPATLAAAKTAALGAGQDQPTGMLQKTVAARQDNGPEGGTRIMQTRVASQEEIDFLRAAEHRRARRKLALIVVAVGAFVLLALLLWPRRPAPETTLSWPRDAAGNYLDAFVPAPSGSFEEGGYELAFPGVPGWTSQSIPGGVAVATRAGRDHDVPLKLFLVERLDPREVQIDRLQSLAEWKDEVKQSGGHWNFDPPSAVFYLGDANGIPCVSLAYQREDDAPWHGMATLFRHGRRRVVLRVEVPAAERVRAEQIVSTLFLHVSQDFVNRHWEGSSEPPRGEAAQLIRRARLELEHIAPSAWAQVGTMIIDALRLATLHDQPEQEQEAMVLLLRLRDRQTIWFNAQRLAFFNALAQGDDLQAGRIAEFCKAVFSSDLDQRYYTIRRNDW